MLQYSKLSGINGTDTIQKKRIGLRNVNSWNRKNQTYRSIRTMQQSIWKTKKISVMPTMMCEGTDCMGNSCGWNCGTP